MSRDFDAASSDFVEVGDVPALDIAGDEVTVSAWVRLESINGEQKVLAKWSDAAGAFQYLMTVIAADNILFVINNGAGNVSATGTTSIVAGQWFHCAGTYDGSDVRVYLNGIEEDSTSGSGNMVSSTVPVTIGAGSGGSGTENPFDGEIGHCAIWDAALSAGEIASLAAGISPRKIRGGASLQFYGPLNGQTPEYDVIGGLDLTVNGAVKAEEPPIPNSIVAP